MILSESNKVILVLLVFSWVVVIPTSRSITLSYPFNASGPKRLLWELPLVYTCLISWKDIFTRCRFC
jgi:hypothetical protein